MAVWNYIEAGNLYLNGVISWVLYYVSSMVWPIIVALLLYMTGDVIQDYQSTKTVKLSNLFGAVGLASLGLVAIGILDMVSFFIEGNYSLELGVAEIACGVVISVLSNFVKGRLIAVQPEAAEDEAV